MVTFLWWELIIFLVGCGLLAISCYNGLRWLSSHLSWRK